MPFRSEKQRRWLWMHRPDIARRWTRKYGSKIVPKKKKKKKRNIAREWRKRRIHK